ncbi:hypothetical protein RM572_04875 [Streptomyces sp. DSM 42041]|uniref:Uncharacterized protein n=1 Tax=Streptomyces hazeniae TaxID=3075538 RepID=A0ABU2NMY6_9ACTN|nr:hypothetical protein [Streptomyces sp. DSM 42041]MDT0378109.1 hypothetical protein [Streptomyces sp. DSM 42041]
MNVVDHIYFGIVTRDGGRYRARVEVADHPDVVVVSDSDHSLTDDVSVEIAGLVGAEPDDIGVHLFGHHGGDGTPVYAGAAVFDGSLWVTRFPAQEDLPHALSVPPTPTYESAAARVRQALAAAVRRPEADLDVEFFEIVPRQEGTATEGGAPEA